jgi:hypothetical protein
MSAPFTSRPCRVVGTQSILVVRQICVAARYAHVPSPTAVPTACRHLIFSFGYEPRKQEAGHFTETFSAAGQLHSLIIEYPTPSVKGVIPVEVPVIPTRYSVYSLLGCTVRRTKMGGAHRQARNPAHRTSPQNDARVSRHAKCHC